MILILLFLSCSSCDFGSAKQLNPAEPNVSYICSRYYRAPELVFESTNYTVAIDVWSVGAVMGELLLGSPLFPGDSSVDQLIEIIKVLGSPTKAEIFAMKSVRSGEGGDNAARSTQQTEIGDGNAGS